MNREYLIEAAVYNLKENRFEVFFNDMSTRPKRSCGWIVSSFESLYSPGEKSQFVDCQDLSLSIDRAWDEIEMAGGFNEVSVEVAPGEKIPFMNEEKEDFSG